MPLWTAWAKPLGGGSVAVIVLNSSPDFVSIEVPLASLGLSSETVSTIDVWTGEPAGNFTSYWSIVDLPSHGSQFVVMVPLPTRFIHGPL